MRRDEAPSGEAKGLGRWAVGGGRRAEWSGVGEEKERERGGLRWPDGLAGEGPALLRRPLQ